MSALEYVLLILGLVCLAAGAVMFFAVGIWQGFIPICVGIAPLLVLGYLRRKKNGGQ